MCCSDEEVEECVAVMKKLKSVLQCVAVCCSVLQCDALCCSVVQCVAVCCSVLQCVAVGCSVLQCVAVGCSVMQWVAECRLWVPYGMAAFRSLPALSCLFCE